MSSDVLSVVVNAFIIAVLGALLLRRLGAIETIVSELNATCVRRDEMNVALGALRD